MALSVVMPALEMAQETGKVVAWLKRDGEQVRKGDMLLEVETDKAVVEIEAAGDGVLGGITAKPGDVVPVGRTIAWLLGPGEAPPAAAPVAQSGRTTASVTAAATPTVAAPSAGGPRLSPKARRLAQEHGVDVSSLKGSGPGGEILADDILAAAKSQPTEARQDEQIQLSSVAQLMAERTTQSWTTVPHFFLVRDLDATVLNASRQKQLSAIDSSHGVRLTHGDLIVAAVARALRTHPRMNASWTGRSAPIGSERAGIRLNEHVNVAVAIAVDGAVVTGVIADADRMAIGDLATRRRDLADRARAGRLQPADITGATFTVSNLGMFDVDAFTAIIVPPQAGILAVGAIADRVVAVDGKALVRPTLTLTLSSDHRVIDGAGAAAFLADVIAETGRL
jgi:pyruvate dehydrogenase E2 component (dihydrolipoamide acetyltransferase)